MFLLNYLVILTRLIGIIGASWTSILGGKNECLVCSGSLVGKCNHGVIGGHYVCGHKKSGVLINTKHDD